MSRRRIVVGSFTAVAAALAVTGAVAFACVTPATVSLSTAEGRPGDVITIKGSAFSMPPNVTTGVQIRWGGADGKVLAEVMPDEAGTFTTKFTVPDGPPGFYSVAAVLKDASGTDVSGTPGRAMFEVKNVQAAPAPPPEIRSFTPTADPSGSSFPVALVMGLGVVGLLLFAGGFVAVTRSRRSAAPTPARIRGE